MKLNGPPADITGYTKEQMWSDILEWSQYSDSIASGTMHTLASVTLSRIRSGLPELPPSAMNAMAAFKQTYLLDTSIRSIIEERA